MIYGLNEKVAILECPRLPRSLVSCCTLGAHGAQSVITAQRRPGLPVEVSCSESRPPAARGLVGFGVLSCGETVKIACTMRQRQQSHWVLLIFKAE
jgi:hypothetical protein